MTNWDETGNPQPLVYEVHLRDIRTLGDSVTAQYHSLLVEGIATGSFRDLWTQFNAHGFVLKGVDCVVDGIYAQGHQANAAIFRHSNPYGQAKRLQISRLFAKSYGVGYDTGGINFVANGPGEVMTNTTLMGFNTRRTHFGLNLDASNGGTIADFVALGFQIDDPEYNGISTQGNVQRAQIGGGSITASKGNATYIAAGATQASLTDVYATASAGDGLLNEGIDTQVQGGRLQSSGGSDIRNTGGTLTLSATTKYTSYAGTPPLAAGYGAWVNATYLNGWGDLGGNWYSAGYRISADRMVHLRGHMQGGGQGTAIFQLPPEARPSKEVRFPVNSSGQPGAVSIAQDGSVYAERISGWLALDGIAFGLA